jgi:DnaJ-like protein
MPTLPTLNDSYDKFGLPPTATSADVRAAYRTLVKRHHPDLYETAAAKRTATETLQELNEAYAAILRHQRPPLYAVPHEHASAWGAVPDRMFNDINVVRRPSHRKLKRAISAAMSSACAAVVLYFGIRHLRYAVELDLLDSLTYTLIISFVLAIILATLLAPDPQE